MNGSAIHLSKYESGGLIDYKSYRIPSLPFKIGHLSFTLNDFPVEVGQRSLKNSEVDGTIGNDLIVPFSGVVINFDKMFIEYERLKKTSHSRSLERAILHTAIVLGFLADFSHPFFSYLRLNL